MWREAERPSEASNQPLRRAAFGRPYKVVERHCLAGPRMQQLARAANANHRRVVILRSCCRFRKPRDELPNEA